MKGNTLAALARWVLSLRYRVTIEGLEAVTRKGCSNILLLPNHPAYLDPVILIAHFLPHFHPHTLADKDNMAKPVVRGLAKRLGVIPLPDPAVHGKTAIPEVTRVLGECAAHLRQGENVMFYPAGHIYHSRHEDLGGNSAVETILAQAPEARIVLVRTTGMWGSSFSRASHPRPNWGKGLLRGLGCLLLNGLFFGPRREVRIVLAEPEDFPRTADRRTLNRTLEAFYNQDAPPARYVPYTLWEQGGSREMPEPVPQRMEGNLTDVPASIQAQVREKLAELAGRQDFADTAQLARDLGLDSLGRMELQIWIHQTFGHGVEDPEALQTVGDCLLVAMGQASTKGSATLTPPPGTWFGKWLPLEIPVGDTLTEVFLHQAARDPRRPALADLQGGVRTYRDLVTAIFVLKPHVAALEGEKVGIMLPASVAAAVAFLTVLFTGKVPVMVNWTAGSRNLRHGLDLLGVKHVITSGQLVSKVEAGGADLSAIKDRFWTLEDMAKHLTPAEKLLGFLKARVSWRPLIQAEVPETAVILFTSGSESLPKAVPLTHANLLANVRDLASIIPFQPTDRMVGFLPPFHSFGLTGTQLLPLCAGLPVVYFPNPTDGRALAQIVETYAVTLLVGTPTFLSSIVRSASDAQLAHLRMVVAGAEKCPEALYDLLAQRWPGMRVLEGYGITECSPVLSVNRFEAPQRGTIGSLLPSVVHALVDLDSGQRVPPGGTGMLLVRGPSVFGGYLHHDGPSPFVLFEGEAWYRTGDLVRETPDGTLVFAGRLKRFVKLGGEMVSLPAVEEVLLNTFARPDDQEIPLAVEATPSDAHPELVLFSIRPLARDDANAALAQAGLSPLHFIRQVRVVEAIPVLGTGKTDYRALKAQLT